MQELDLTPFKVEFDRDITIEDLRIGDICLIGNPMGPSEDDPDVLGILTNTRDSLKLDGHFTFAGLPHADIVHCVKSYAVSKYIKAIYRINKFKY